MRNNPFISILFFAFLTSCYSKSIEIKEGIEVTASSQYDFGLTDYLTDNNDSTGWNSGKANINWLKYNFEKPIYLDSLKYITEVDFGTENIHKIYYKLKGTKDSSLVKETIYIGSQNEIIIHVNKDNVYELIFIFDKKESWIKIKQLSVFGKYKNWVKIW